MHGAIGARFKLVTASLSAGGGKEGGESQAQHNEFENEIFLSVVRCLLKPRKDLSDCLL